MASKLIDRFCLINAWSVCVFNTFGLKVPNFLRHFLLD